MRLLCLLLFLFQLLLPLKIQPSDVLHLSKAVDASKFYVFFNIILSVEMFTMVITTMQIHLTSIYLTIQHMEGQEYHDQEQQMAHARTEAETCHYQRRTHLS